MIAAIVLAGLVLFGGLGGGYSVTAEFQNGGQLVKGNVVQVGGTKAGVVKDIKITRAGQAEVRLEIDDTYVPLRRGTKAIIRQASLSGIANRYVDLQLPGSRSTPAGAEGDEIDDGGRIPVSETTTAVDLDQLFNTFDPVTRVAVQKFFKGSSRMFEGYGKEANRGYQYLNPALSTSRRLFNELNADRPLLERFIVDSAKFMTAAAERREDLASLVGNLNATTGALAREKEDLAGAIRAFPDFMRQANTTFVNLRTTLDAVDPLVDASKPVAPKLRRLLDELRPFVADAEPTVAGLNDIVRKPGAFNDLTELNRTFPALAQIALDTRERAVNTGARRVNVGRVRGAFPEMTEALRRSAPLFAFQRPYTPDLVGWFDDFSTTGAYDALGGISRTQAYFNLNSPAGGPLLVDAAPALDPLTGALGVPNPLQQNLDLRGQVIKQFTRLEQFKRCPGAAEEAAADGSNVWTGRAADFDRDGTVDCDESDRATGDLSR